MSKVVIVVSVLCVILIAAIGVGYAATTPTFSIDNVDVKYSSADYDPVDPLVSSDGAIKYFSDISGVDEEILSDGYTFYQLNTYKIILAESRYDDSYGYVFWIDGSGCYQHLMFTDLPGEVTV